MRRGFTLVEILVALAVLAVLMLAFVGFFGSTLRATGHLKIRNELLSEAQVAHQLIVGRLKEAWYVWPPGSVLRLANSGWTTQNTLDGGRDWTVGPTFLAMILPPQEDGTKCSVDPSGCFRFFAYYPMKRDHYVTNASPVEALDRDGANDSRVWVLMEYRAQYRRGGLAACPVKGDGSPKPGETAYRGRRGRLLLDYVQPLSDPWDPRYDYAALFEYRTDAGRVSAVTVHLRLARKARERVYRIPVEPGSLVLTASPKNLGVAARTTAPYCQ